MELEKAAESEATEAWQSSEPAIEIDRSRLRRLLETTKVVPWEADAESWRFTYIGPQAVRLLGFPCRQWLRQGFWVNHLHPDDRDDAVEFCLRSSLRGEDYEFEYRMVGADGRVVWIHDIVSVELAHGKPKTLKGFLIDITDRKQTETTLQQNEERMRLLADALPAFIAYVDSDQRYRFNNAYYETYWGVPRAQLFGRSIREVMGDRNYAAIRQDIEAVLSGQERKLEKQLLGPDGRVRTMRAFLVPDRDARGKVRGFYALATDISEQKRLEREILEISDRERQRISRDLHDSLGQELTGLSYLVKGLHQKLSERDAPETESARMILEGLQESLGHVRNAVRGLTPVDVDVHGLSVALEQLASSIRARCNINCRFQQQGAVSVPDNTVATHLYRIAQEAVNNAVKHSRADRIVVRLTSRTGYLLLRISDNGIGLGAVSNTSGMGLRIMKYRAELIGASIDIGAEAGGGTVVECRLQQR